MKIKQESLVSFLLFIQEIEQSSDRDCESLQRFNPRLAKTLGYGNDVIYAKAKQLRSLNVQIGSRVEIEAVDELRSADKVKPVVYTVYGVEPYDDYSYKLTLIHQAVTPFQPPHTNYTPVDLPTIITDDDDQPF